MLIYFCIRELKTTKSKMDSQTKQVSEYASRMDDYDKKFEENSRKFGTLLAVSVFPHEPRAEITRVTRATPVWVWPLA